MNWMRCVIKSSSIKSHLSSYSILRKRKTTISHAFASALAPSENYDETKVVEAMCSLGLDPDNLACVYCGGEAETWDHLTNLVKNKEPNGYGHQVGNLVPCCKDCNSKKGNKDVLTFLSKKFGSTSKKPKQINNLLTKYRDKYCDVRVDLQELRKRKSEDLKKLEDIRSRIFFLMAEADQVVIRIRSNTSQTGEKGLIGP